MLIIPIEKRPDWRRPPLLTIGLLLLNLCIFALYQSADNERWVNAYEAYEPLLPIERAAALDYMEELYQNGHRPFQLDERGDYHPNEIAAIAIHDRNFANLLTSQPELIAEDQREQWLELRAAFEQLRHEVSSERFGLNPTTLNAQSLLGHMFLHGSWDHLIGNMVFLFLFGFLLELVLGWRRYLALYVVSGLAAGLAYSAFKWGQSVPLVGASGAISGLMGAYVVLYGMQKIRFYYTLIFYFGEFRAPAMTILPLWLLKEIHGFFWLDDQVAYSAHFGGMVCGALIMALIKQLGLHIGEQDLQNEADHEAPQRQWLARIYKAVGDFNQPYALQLCRSALKELPHSEQLWQAYYKVAARQPDTKTFHQVSFDCLKHLHTLLENKAALTVSAELCRSYLGKAKQPVALKPALRLLYARHFLGRGEAETGIKLLEVFLDEAQQHSLSQAQGRELQEQLKLALNYLARRQDKRLKPFKSAALGLKQRLPSNAQPTVAGTAATAP